MENNLNILLQKTTIHLASYLEKVLPPLFDNWWIEAVVNKLSFQQQRRVKQHGNESLKSLDLAALLRLLDQNWYQLSRSLDLTSESRHYVKEMQTVRNRWAHTGSEGMPVEDVYRDIDTLQRLASLINADDIFIQEIRAAKEALLPKANTTKPEDDSNKEEPEQGEVTENIEFEQGQIVFLISNPNIRGAVVSILPSKPENRYNVFIDNAIQTFYASQIKAEDKQEKESLFLPSEQFHSYLTALQIRYPGLSTLYSLNAARIDFIPYQFRPVLKFIKSDRPRLLIADGVGVGKTIEAGLILRELQARRDIRSILIICPRPLVTERKWQIEMKRFEERFTHLDGGTLRYCINEMDLEGFWPEQHKKSILPYSLFDETLLYGSKPGRNGKRRKGLLDLDPPPRFDLVIVDEAHHIRNQETYSHKAVRFFCDHAEAVVFLTATPIQLGSHDLFVLLNALRPDLIIDQESFEHMAQPNPFINRAVTLTRAQKAGWETQVRGALKEAEETPWGQAILRHNPEFLGIYNRLADGNLTAENRVQLITDLEALHTFAGIINRTLRRDIGDFTIRKPETVVVEFTPPQKELHDTLLDVQAEIFRQIHGDLNVKFMMTTIRRQAASCLYGLVPFLQDILNRHLDELSWDEADNTGQVPHIASIESIENQIQTILKKARALDSKDLKLIALRKIIKDKQSMPNNRVMLFSSFRHTLHYLYEHLKSDGFRVGMVHGGTADEDRIEFRNRFEMSRDHDDSLDVLLFSEIGCEGLDYQFCDCIVNYDLPWNPMRVEQRIGRIDRNGQRSETVAIYNLITPGTVDADIYDRCLMRIGVFNNALGGSEEILGEITQEIRDIAENFSLSEKERREKLQQLADNKIRLVQEQDELEQKQLELFGIRLPQEQMEKEIKQASNFWLSPSSLRRIITVYVQQSCQTEQEFILGEKALKTLRLSQQSRNRLLHDYQKLPRLNTSVYRQWEDWLKGGNPHLLMTFESECASHHPEAVFMMPLHPLVKQAALSFDTNKRAITDLKVHSDDVPKGKYEFAIYQWQFHGVREDLVLQPVAGSDTVAEYLPSMLEKAEKNSTGNAEGVDPVIWDNLDTQHHLLWSEARTKHQLRTQELAEYQRESLATSHKARISLLEEQLSKATDEKIQRMRRSQITAAEADYARRLQALEIAMERADITTAPVAYGVVQVEECIT